MSNAHVSLFALSFKTFFCRVSSSWLVRAERMGTVLLVYKLDRVSTFWNIRLHVLLTYVKHSGKQLYATNPERKIEREKLSASVIVSAHEMRDLHGTRFDFFKNYIVL